MQKEILAGASYSDIFAKDYKVRLPDTIEHPTSARFISTAHDSHANDRATAQAKRIVDRFEEVADEARHRINKHQKDLKLFNLPRILEEFRKSHRSAEQILIEVHRSVMEGNTLINPTTYLHAHRHFVIAKIFIEKFDEMDLESIKDEKLDLTDEKRENFNLGMFVGLEPILVTAVFSSDGRDDAALSQKYGRLVDKYSNIVATMYPKEYIAAMDLNKPSFAATVYSKVVGYLEAERNGQILL